ncbi:MAG: NAD(P)-binding domain-containing protein, partial [Pseudomonadota bacterium]
MKTINLIGPGRVGETLLRCVKRADLYVVQDVCGRRFERLERLVQKLGIGRAASLSNARAADVWLIAVPDGAIKDVAADLA